MQQMAISFAFHDNIKPNGDGHKTDWEKYQKAFEQVKIKFDESLRKFEDN